MYAQYIVLCTYVSVYLLSYELQVVLGVLVLGVHWKVRVIHHFHDCQELHDCLCKCT